mmetsp:Transcript_69118/g.114907  ORF Transcript_69118/g.114907 Transcript_69118/m.114907 type:complete len:336 (-) Transcript_69118:180-1187(-)
MPQSSNMLTTTLSSSRHSCIDCALDMKVDGCSQFEWDVLLARTSPRPRVPVLVDAGANKGYTIARFMALWSGERLRSIWHDEIRKYARAQHSGHLAWNSCGSCFDCRAREPKAVGIPSQAHALELAPSNRALLRYLVNATNLTENVHVHDLAASNASLHMAFPHTAQLIGYEGNTVSSNSMAVRLRPVNATSIDNFMESERLFEVYQLTIDTEGHDAKVLEGAHEALRQRKITVLQFEFGGKWPRTETLAKTVESLGAFGYECFLLARFSPIPISGVCWLDGFGTYSWRNVLCAYKDQHLNVLYTAGAKANKLNTCNRTERNAKHRSVPKRSFGS